MVDPSTPTPSRSSCHNAAEEDTYGVEDPEMTMIMGLDSSFPSRRRPMPAPSGSSGSGHGVPWLVSEWERARKRVAEGMCGRNGARASMGEEGGREQGVGGGEAICSRHLNAHAVNTSTNRPWLITMFDIWLACCLEAGPPGPHSLHFSYLLCNPVVRARGRGPLRRSNLKNQSQHV